MLSESWDSGEMISATVAPIITVAEMMNLWGTPQPGMPRERSEPSRATREFDASKTAQNTYKKTDRTHTENLIDTNER